MTARYELIVIGSSWGGMSALQTILCALPPDFHTPIAIAQHRHRQSAEGLPDFYRRSCKVRVVDADDKQRIDPSTIYFAPADYHLLVENGSFDLSCDEAVRYSRPSIDVLFESAADAYGPRLIGVVLTGANDDGAAGAKRIKKRGGLLVVQDPKTAEAPQMPQAAIAAAPVDRILPLEEIAPYLVERCQLAVYR
ncbi:MAG TPA: chemotaxis protein CheB [Thermoanaerobaculia bacterium]|nr:chemotaxis protein CheB [Thermoanaerobaculia bacterium]